MSRRFMVRAVLAAASVLAVSASNSAGAADALTIDTNALTANSCFGLNACALDGADIATTGGVLQKKDLNGASGFGISGGASGAEIDIGQTLRVDFDESRSIVAIKILFLFNGPEHSDRAEKARVIADGTDYTLAILNNEDNASATWSGSGAVVTKCGATTLAGTGCFIITNPFPGDVDRLDFTAITGSTPFSGAGTNDSDYAIGFIDVAAETTLNLADCANPAGCEVDTGFNLSNMNAQNPGGSTEAEVIPVEFLDCRYVPQDCLALLPPAGDSAANDNAAREILIGLGVIKTLDPTGPNRLHPAAQMLNAKSLLPADVTSLFVAPEVLPPLYIAARWRGQSVNAFRIKGYFFKTDSTIQFSDVFDGLIDVPVLTGGVALGCDPDLGNLLAWDVITTVPELAKTTGGLHVDTPINVGCINPTKVKGSRLSLYSINTEIAPDTWGPTIKSTKPLVTVNNDAVFARLVESLWKDIGDIRANFACKQADPTPTGGQAPLSSAVCRTLSASWTEANKKIKDCVTKTFKPLTGLALGICDYARERVDLFGAALPATPTGPDPYNRLAELEGRLETFKHVWDTRFMLSLEPAGFCREWGTCAP